MADSKKIREVAMWVRDTMDENHYNFHHYGTGAAMVGKHLEGHLPVRNWQLGTMDTVELIDAKTLKAEFGEKMDGCYACSVRCKKRVTGGRHPDRRRRRRAEVRRRRSTRPSAPSAPTSASTTWSMLCKREPGAELVRPRQRLDRRDDRLGDGVLRSAASSPRRTPAAWRWSGATARS